MLGFAFILKIITKVKELGIHLEIEWTQLHLILIYLAIGTISIVFLAKRAFDNKKDIQTQPLAKEIGNLIGTRILSEIFETTELEVEGVDCNLTFEDEGLHFQIISCKIQKNDDMAMVTADFKCKVVFNHPQMTMKVTASVTNSLNIDSQDQKSLLVQSLRELLTKIDINVDFSPMKRTPTAFYLILSNFSFPANLSLSIIIGKIKLGPYVEAQLQENQIFKFNQVYHCQFVTLEFENSRDFHFELSTGKEEIDEDGINLIVKKYLVTGKDNIEKFESDL